MQRFSRIETSEDPDGTGLKFTDVLFGFVFKEVFIRFKAWGSVPGPNAWTVRLHLVLVAAVTMGSYIGFRNSLKRQKYAIRFFNLPFVKFGLDQAMVVLYFVLATRTPEKVEDFADSTATFGNSWVVTTLLLVVAIFLLYVAWDLISLLMHARKAYAEIKWEWPGLAISVLFAIAAAVLWWFADNIDGASVANGALGAAIALTIGYRFAKDHRPKVGAGGASRTGGTS